MNPDFLLTVLFVTGLIVEAMTGAISAGKKHMDLFGVLVVANVTAFGGGVVRDLLLDRHPILFIGEPKFLLLTSICAIVMVVIARYFETLRWLFLSLDALGMITFSIVGAMRALDMGFGMAVASLTGMVTGVFGGIMRDILCNEIPLAFRTELYASVSIFSVWLYLVLRHLEAPESLSVPITLAAGFILRILAVKFDWHIPKFVYRSGPLDREE